VKSLFKKSSNSNLDYLLKTLHKEKSNFFLTGLVNVESGDISFRTRRYDEKTDDVYEFRECSECEPIEENRVFFVDCKTCGRSSNNYFWIKSGDGDGVYATFQILRLDEATGEGIGFGLAVVFFPTEVFAQPLVEHALKTASDYEEPSTAFGFTTDILEDSGSFEAFEITTFDLEESGAVYVADKYALVDSPDAIMCMNLDNPGYMQLTFLAFSEAVGDQKGPYPNDISPRPRVLIGIDSSWLKEKGFKASMARPDSPEVFQDWVMTGIGACHIEPMHEASFWFNSKINEAMQKYNYAASWLLQGAIHGDKDSINELSRYDEFVSDPEWIKTWLEQRHQFAAAADYERSGKLPFKLGINKLSKDSKPEVVASPDWSSFRRFWSDSEIVISPAIAGFIDIEGGQVAISGKWLPKCDECYGTSNCKQCGRNPTNSISIRSGEGDGAYCVHELWFDGKAVGGFVVFDNGDEYASPIMNFIDKAHDDVYENSESEKLLHQELTGFIYDYFDKIDPTEELFEIGKIIAEENPVYSSEGESIGILVFGESGEGIDSSQAMVTLNNIRAGEYKVFLFAHRARNNNNCLVPKAILILDTESATRIGLKSGFAQKIDLKKEMELWSKSTVFARIGEPLAVPVMLHNYLWAQVRLVGGSENETIDEYRALDLKLESLSWSLVLSERVDLPDLRSNLKSDLETFSDYVENIHHLRGQFGRTLGQ
jgi:hypothetical protein